MPFKRLQSDEVEIKLFIFALKCNKATNETIIAFFETIDITNCFSAEAIFYLLAHLISQNMTDNPKCAGYIFSPGTKIFRVHKKLAAKKV